MKAKMKFLLPKMICLFVVASLILTSCGSSDDDDDDEEIVDTENPTISTDEPIADQTFSSGVSVHYTGTFADNIELDRVVFSIEDTSDETSTSALKGATGIDDDPWEPEDYEVDLSSTSYEFDDDIFDEVFSSDDWTGTYELTITVYDTSENSATETIDIYLD